MLHTDPIYNTVEQKSRWKGTKFSGAPRNNGVPQLEDLKLRDEPRDPRDNKSWQIRKSERRPWRSHAVEEGAIVQVEEEPSERMKSAEPVQVVQSPTMRSLRPRTVKQELDLAKKKKFVRTKLPRAEKTIERLEEEEAERARAKSPARFTPIRRKSRQGPSTPWRTGSKNVRELSDPALVAQQVTVSSLALSVESHFPSSRRDTPSPS